MHFLRDVLNNFNHGKVSKTGKTFWLVPHFSILFPFVNFCVKKTQAKISTGNFGRAWKFELLKLNFENFNSCLYWKLTLECFFSSIRKLVDCDAYSLASSDKGKLWINQQVVHFFGALSRWCFDVGKQTIETWKNLLRASIKREREGFRTCW